ncbi:MAG: chemotaxis protein methyltransferase CheR [Candidatus Magnetoglobus multicellularis str. Araruama]|uniref:protein-glutamate O-methyltransferase n=1 Tax=Candidatus Magnetoglobus multicellularis str. Araruama TaxID=890399 RepID=A0A1V1P966_9BACT|nr:MAG: chemotaxis protein methyltransferase CheR [Candidatus Magnetoglobus multicellularis str. Araruama]
MFRRLIQEKCGIALDDTKAYLLENRLARMLTDSLCKNFGDLYFKLKSTRSDKLLKKMIEAVTTKETLWFRDQYPFKALHHIIFPEIVTKSQVSEINIWSAGCSTGQETYSIAMTAQEYSKTITNAQNFIKRISIMGTDISSQSIEHALIGEYDEIAIQRGLSETRLKQFFYKNGKNWQINDTIKKMTLFEYQNLLELPKRFGPFDIIFLRNVMIYFSEELKKNLFKQMTSILKKDGYMFLGTGETVHGYSDRFHIIRYDGGIFFQLS